MKDFPGELLLGRVCPKRVILAGGKHAGRGKEACMQTCRRSFPTRVQSQREEGDAGGRGGQTRGGEWPQAIAILSPPFLWGGAAPWGRRKFSPKFDGIPFPAPWIVELQEIWGNGGRLHWSPDNGCQEFYGCQGDFLPFLNGCKEGNKIKSESGGYNHANEASLPCTL